MKPHFALLSLTFILFALACSTQKEASHEATHITTSSDSTATDAQVPAKPRVYPFSLGTKVELPRITTGVITVSGGYACPGSWPTPEEVSQVPFTSPPREYSEREFLNQRRETPIEVDDPVDDAAYAEHMYSKVEDLSLMQEPLKRVIKQLEAHYEGERFGQRLDLFECMVRMEDAGCEEMLCIAQPTAAIADGSRPDGRWVVFHMYYGNVSLEQ